MTSPTEEATWANLKQELEEQLEAWHVLFPNEHADTFVRKLRRTGWRIPLPDHATHDESWKKPRTRPARTEASQRYIDACREAIRTAADA